LDVLAFPYPRDSRFHRSQQIGCIIGLLGGALVGSLAALIAIGSK
jgi:hypothetical protein